MTGAAISIVVIFAADVINGGAPAPFIAVLLPSGAPVDGATGKAATHLAMTI